ncbi:ribonuclease H-like domain-containing protein [Tanacetum coccineum]
MTLQDHGDSGWYMDTGATSHLASDTSKLTFVSNKIIISSILVGNGNSIPVTNTGHSMLPTLNRPLDLHNVLVTPNIIKNLIYVRQFTRDNSFSIEFDPFGFTVKDLWTRHLLLRCNSKGDLYPVLPHTSSPIALLSTNQSTWHQRLEHPGNEVFRFLVSNKMIDCNKTKSTTLCHACQIGKHTRLPFFSSNSRVENLFDIVHSDIWTSPIPWFFEQPGFNPATIRTVLNLVVSHVWPIHQLDVKNAFLHGYLSETVYMHQPPGFVDPAHPNYVCHLQKSLYGLKQASRAWFQRFSSYAIRVGFIHNKNDSSLFVYQQGTKTTYLLLYVDAISLYMVSKEDDSSPQGYEDKGNLRQEFKTSGGFVEENNWDGKWDHPWESEEDPQVNPTTDDFPLNQDYKANGMEENKSMFEISGNNFNDWFLQLKMVLRVERKLFVIEQPISLASPTDSEYLRSGMRTQIHLRTKLEWSGFDLIQTFPCCYKDKGKPVGPYVIR